MECEICSNDFSSRRKPTCVSCAHATLYGPRIRQAIALLDREKQHTHAEAILRPGNDGVIASLSEDADWDVITAGIKTQCLQKSRDQIQAVEARIEDISNKAEHLRQQMEGYKQHIEEQKARHTVRQQEVADERKQMATQRQRALEPVQLATRKAVQRLEKVRNRIVDARALLCHEAASLSGLQKRRGHDGKTEYWLGGVAIPDLRDLNGKLQAATPGTHGEDKLTPQPYEVATAAMDNICRLLGNCCHYLSVRLPAEMILPHNDFPHAMIMFAKASYKIKDPPYPSTSTSQSSSTAASRLNDQKGVVLPRPRPLHLERPLPDYVKNDSKTFALFVEGVMLLAWDVAWLCRTQGVGTIDSFDDVCAIGKNLHQLLASTEQARPQLYRNISTATTRTDRSHRVMATPAVGLGTYSHGSAFHFIAGSEGVKKLDGWRLASPTRLLDKLKSYLLNEISGAEWDFLSGEEWDEEQKEELPVAPVPQNDATGERPDQNTTRNTSGWMMLRGRGGDG